MCPAGDTGLECEGRVGVSARAPPRYSGAGTGVCVNVCGRDAGMGGDRCASLRVGVCLGVSWALRGVDRSEHLQVCKVRAQGHRGGNP